MKTPAGAEVALVEVFPRDGLQALYPHEWVPLDTATKIDLCERLAACGFEQVEAASFAHPARLPQLADAEAVIGALGPLGSRARALVPNGRGLGRAIDAGARKVAMFLVASETYQVKNVGMDTAAALEEIAGMKRQADARGLESCVALGTVFVCPYEGRMDVGRIGELVARLADMGFAEIALADTAGTADPRHVGELCSALVERWTPTGVELAIHLHDAHGLGLVNVVAALEAGIRRFETSLLGIGAGTAVPGDPRAMGNVSTIDVLDLLHRLDLRTGVDADGASEVARWLDDLLFDRPGGAASAARS